MEWGLLWGRREGKEREFGLRIPKWNARWGKQEKRNGLAAHSAVQSEEEEEGQSGFHHSPRVGLQGGEKAENMVAPLPPLSRVSDRRTKLGTRKNAQSSKRRKGKEGVRCVLVSKNIKEHKWALFSSRLGGSGHFLILSLCPHGICAKPTFE